ncbi:hypothetical protein EOM57_03880 [Candidatus Saccharibacteria bacterium]|nr:hypothetical protein [Candidatus Saccharibacteria bacterium]
MKILNASNIEIQSLKIKPDTVISLKYVCTEDLVTNHQLFAQRADFISGTVAGEPDGLARANGSNALDNGRVLGRVGTDAWQRIDGYDNTLNFGLMTNGNVYDFEIKVEGTELDTGKVDIVLTSAVFEPYQIAESTFLMKTDGLGDFRLFKLRPPSGFEEFAAYISIQEVVKTQSSPIELFEAKTLASLLYDNDENTWTVIAGAVPLSELYGSVLMSPTSSLAPRYGTLADKNQNDKRFYKLAEGTFETTMAAANDILFFIDWKLDPGIRLAAVSGELYTHICTFDADTIYKVRYNVDKWEIYKEMYELGNLVSTTILDDNELGDVDNFPLVGWAELVFDIENILIEE